MTIIIFQNSTTILLLTTTIGFAILNLPPLNEAVKQYLEFEPYTPHFAVCNCEETSTEEEVETAGDKHESTAPETPPDKTEDDIKEPKVENATGDTGHVPTSPEKHDYKFPVPYKRRTPFNSSTNATNDMDNYVTRHVQTLARSETLEGGKDKVSPLSPHNQDA